MEVKIQKWGNSNGIRIPSSLLKSLNLKTNDTLNIEQEDDRIVISLPQKNHLTLEERFEIYEKLPDDEKGRAKPYDWGEDVGREIID